MNKHIIMSLHYLCRGLILLGFAGYIVYLAQAGKLQYYIVPRMIPYVQYATIALYVLAIYSLYLAWKEREKKRHEHSCGCSHAPPKSALKSAALYSLFIFPIMIGFLLPDKMMGSDVVAVKGMNLNVSAAVQRDSRALVNESNDTLIYDSVSVDADESSSELAAEHIGEVSGDIDAVPLEAEDNNNIISGETTNTTTTDSNATDEYTYQTVADVLSEEDFEVLFPSDQYSVELAELGIRIYEREVIEVKEEGFLEMLTMLDLYRSNFMEREVHISGFVYREEGMDPNTFVVSRMAMQCCSADAMPYGFLVYDERANQYELDTWITVEGKMGVTEYNDIEIVQLEATNITRIEAPSDPYVYPYFDELVKLADH